MKTLCETSAYEPVAAPPLGPCLETALRRAAQRGEGKIWTAAALLPTRRLLDGAERMTGTGVGPLAARARGLTGAALGRGLMAAALGPGRMTSVAAPRHPAAGSSGTALGLMTVARLPLLLTVVMAATATGGLTTGRPLPLATAGTAAEGGVGGAGEAVVVGAVAALVAARPLAAQPLCPTGCSRGGRKGHPLPGRPLPRSSGTSRFLSLY